MWLSSVRSPVTPRPTSSRRSSFTSCLRIDLRQRNKSSSGSSTPEARDAGARAPGRNQTCFGARAGNAALPSVRFRSDANGAAPKSPVRRRPAPRAFRTLRTFWTLEPKADLKDPEDLKDLTDRRDLQHARVR